MNLGENVLTALESLRANKLRTFLTLLGVVIGVAAVVALMSIGNGVRTSITKELQAMGTNLLTISNNVENSNHYLALSNDDIDALADPLNAPSIVKVAASIQGFQEVTANGISKHVTVAGVTENYLEVNHLANFRYGGDFIPDDIHNQARVAVLGAQVAEDLFSNMFPVGKIIRIGGTGYEVVGVLVEKNSLLGTDNYIFVPLSTAQSRLYSSMRTRLRERAVTSIAVQAISEEETDAAIAQIKSILRKQHNLSDKAVDDFDIFNQQELIQTLDTVAATLTAFLSVIAGISLLVGGIGIMNIMLVSVTERTREIGIRKAVGALRKNILLQFLLESVTLSLMGALMGIFVGWILSILASIGLQDVDIVLDLKAIAIAVSFAVAIGIIFGMYPAWRAANLLPIEALRYE